MKKYLFIGVEDGSLAVLGYGNDRRLRMIRKTCTTQDIRAYRIYNKNEVTGKGFIKFICKIMEDTGIDFGCDSMLKMNIYETIRSDGNV